MKEENKLAALIKNIAAVCFVVMLALVLIQIVSRNILKAQLAQTEELSRYAMIWGALLGAAAGISYQSHVAVDIITRKLPVRVRRIFSFFVYLAILAFSAVLSWQGVQLVKSSMMQTSTTLKVKMGYIVLVVPLLGILSLYFTVINMLRDLRGKNHEEEEEAAV